MTKIESFTLDHSLVKAPYIRQVSSDHVAPQVIIQKYDLRFLQPNEGALPTAALHSLEHLLATLLRDELPSIIDLSPMGCRTGFYLIILGEHSTTEIQKGLVTVLHKITTMTSIPGMSAKECGNYRDHSLDGAIIYAQEVLTQGISTNPYIKTLPSS